MNQRKSRHYEKLSVSRMEIETGSRILVGSVTEEKILLDKDIKVEPYKDGFAEEGGFQNLSFD